MDRDDTHEFVELVNQLGGEFDKLCQERHDEGARKYGPITWMENDVVRMMLEELADTANYCRYQAVKLLLLQEALENHLQGVGLVEDGQEELTMGIKAFKGTKDVGWGNNS